MEEPAQSWSLMKLHSSWGRTLRHKGNQKLLPVAEFKKESTKHFQEKNPGVLALPPITSGQQEPRAASGAGAGLSGRRGECDHLSGSKTVQF